MSIIEYIRLLRQRFWIIGLGALVAGAAVFLLLSSRPADYRAEVTVLIGGYIQSPNPSELDIRAGVELAQTYSILATTHDVLNAAVAEGGFPLTADELRRYVEVRVVPSTSLVVISVTYTDPELAAAMANEIAIQLILNSPTNLTPVQQAQIDLASAEIERLSLLLQNIRDELEVLSENLSATNNDQALERLRERQNTLINQSITASSALAQFSNAIVNLQQRTNSLTIVEKARVPTSPSGFDDVTLSVIAAFVGAGVAVIFILLSRYFNNTVQTLHEASELLQTPAIGIVPVRYIKKPHLEVSSDRNMATLEAYRTVRAKLVLPYDGHPRHLMFISHDSDEGKDSFIASLGNVIAQADLQVLLIDADFHQPALHQFFNLSNEKGLGTLLKTRPSMDETADVALVRSCIQPASSSNLYLMATGPQLFDPTGIFGSEAMKHWMDLIQIATGADVILINVPPLSKSSDGPVLAVSLNVPVVVVVRANSTHYDTLLQFREEMNRFALNLTGVVLTTSRVQK